MTISPHETNFSFVGNTVIIAIIFLIMTEIEAHGPKMLS